MKELITMASLLLGGVLHAVAYPVCSGTTSIVADYIFQEGDGTNTSNWGSDGSLGNAVLKNGAAFANDIPPSNANCGYSVKLLNNGTGAVESSASYNPLGGATNFTLMAWVRRQSSGNNKNRNARIISDTSTFNSSAAGFEFRFSDSDGLLVLRVNGTEFKSTFGGIAPTSNIWNHVAVVYDGSRPATNVLTQHVHFYINGVQRGDGLSNTALNVSLMTNAAPLTIGNSSVGRTSANQLVGLIDDVRLLRAFAPPAVGNGKTNTAILCYMNSTDDYEPPTITVCAPSVTNAAGATCQVQVPPFAGAVVAADNCTASNALEITQDPVAGTTVGVGTTPITLYVTDGTGNTNTCTTNFIVVDRTPPSITCPGNITTNLPTGQCSAVVTFPAPSASDNCAVPSVNCSPPSGSAFSAGTTTVICTATDASGNFATCSFSVTVNEERRPTLLGWWNVDENAGSTTADSSGFDNNGTLVNNPAWVEGVKGTALQFNGINSYVVAGASGASSSLAVTNALTVSFWAYVTNKNQETFVLNRRSSGAGYEVVWEGTQQYNPGRVRLVVPNGPVVPVSLNDVATNAWNHFGVTWDGSTIRAYLNGQLKSSASYSTNDIGASSQPLYIGQGSAFNGRFQGALDEIRIYKQALSAERIALLYNEYLDCDTDGIPNWWMWQYFGHSMGQAYDNSRAGDDADGDGYTNLQEYDSGTDPTKLDVHPNLPGYYGSTPFTNSYSVFGTNFLSLFPASYQGIYYEGDIVGISNSIGTPVEVYDFKASLIDTYAPPASLTNLSVGHYWVQCVGTNGGLGDRSQFVVLPADYAGWSNLGGHADAHPVADSRMVRAKVNWVRLQIPWATVEPSQGSYDWSLVNQWLMNPYTNMNVRLLNITTIRPPWEAANSQTQWINDVSLMYSNAALQFGTNVVYEVFNEPSWGNSTVATNGALSWDVALGQAVSGSVTAIKTACPDCEVWTPSMQDLVQYSFVVTNAALRGYYADAEGISWHDGSGIYGPVDEYVAAAYQPDTYTSTRNIQQVYPNKVLAVTEWYPRTPDVLGRTNEWASDWNASIAKDWWTMTARWWKQVILAQSAGVNYFKPENGFTCCHGATTNGSSFYGWYEGEKRVAGPSPPISGLMMLGYWLNGAQHLTNWASGNARFSQWVFSGGTTSTFAWALESTTATNSLGAYTTDIYGRQITNAVLNFQPVILWNWPP